MSSVFHTDSRGNKILTGVRTGDVYSHSMVLGADVGVSNRIGLSISLPYITSIYHGAGGHRGPHSGGIDNGRYHGGFQDFRFGLRYNLHTRPVAVTPLVEGVMPSHQYPAIAHSAIGKDLRGLTLGVAAGGLVGSGAAYFHGQYSYTIKEAVEGFRPNQSRATGEFGYLLTDRLTIRAVQTLEVIHDGLNYPEDYVGLRSALSQVHDQITKERVMSFGGGITFSAGRAWDIYGSIVTPVWSENGHIGLAYAVGVSRYFQFGRGRARAPAPSAASRDAHPGVARHLR